MSYVYVLYYLLSPDIYITICISTYAYTCILYYTYIHIYTYIGHIPPEGAVDRSLVQHRQNSLIRGTGLGSDLWPFHTCTWCICVFKVTNQSSVAVSFIVIAVVILQMYIQPLSLSHANSPSSQHYRFPLYMHYIHITINTITPICYHTYVCLPLLSPPLFSLLSLIQIVLHLLNQLLDGLLLTACAGTRFISCCF